MDSVQVASYISALWSFLIRHPLPIIYFLKPPGTLLLVLALRLSLSLSAVVTLNRRATIFF